MDFKDLFVGMAIILVGLVAFIGFSSVLNNEYGSTLGQDEVFNNTYNHVYGLLESDLIEGGVDIADTTLTEEGADVGDTADESLTRRALKTIGMLSLLPGVIPALISDGGNVLNIHPTIVMAAKSVFYAAFGLTLAYLLLLGVRKLS